MLECEALKTLGFRTKLRIDQLQFVSRRYCERCTGLWTDAEPIYTWRRLNGTVCLNGDLKRGLVEGRCELFIYLEEWLSSGKHNKTLFDV